MDIPSATTSHRPRVMVTRRSSPRPVNAHAPQGCSRPRRVRNLGRGPDHSTGGVFEAIVGGLDRAGSAETLNAFPTEPWTQRTRYPQQLELRHHDAGRLQAVSPEAGLRAAFRSAVRGQQSALHPDRAEDLFLIVRVGFQEKSGTERVRRRRRRTKPLRPIDRAMFDRIVAAAIPAEKTMCVSTPTDDFDTPLFLKRP